MKNTTISYMEFYTHEIRKRRCTRFKVGYTKFNCFLIKKYIDVTIDIESKYGVVAIPFFLEKSPKIPTSLGCITYTIEETWIFYKKMFHRATPKNSTFSYLYKKHDKY